MSDEDRIFLSPEEALDAIRSDFNLYPPQTRLFLELGPLILGKRFSLVEDARNKGVWMSTPGRRPVHRMRKISPEALGNLLCRTLYTSCPSSADLAEICARVFETPARPGQNSGGQNGIWIHTGMENFKCGQCGRCCSQLDYHDTLSEADYRLWQEKGRNDILQWIGTTRKNGQVISRNIWMVPGTRNYTDTCPWLRKNKKSHSCECLIHDVKPEICRQYPGTRKHARMTGCPAVETLQGAAESSTFF